ncbi:hypothetical protein [Streptomyces sp. NPDC059468]|uniref:hypothetical protein n=1 Tax=Streptomyces sp. NPDC059468 TaxID=3346845 RepID=UPI0036CE43F9
MSLTFQTTNEPGNVQVVDRFGTLGSIWEITEADVVEFGTEDDISAADIGWHFDISAPRLSTRSGGPFPSVLDAIKVVQDLYDDFAAERVREQTFDHRFGQRVLSIPSGGQP